MTVTKSIIALAQSLNLSVIAEGVETEGQREFLIGAGCTSFQGYILFSRPLALEAFEAMMGCGARKLQLSQVA